jgi:hypothetical protein
MPLEGLQKGFIPAVVTRDQPMDGLNGNAYHASIVQAGYRLAKGSPAFNSSMLVCSYSLTRSMFICMTVCIRPS